MHLEVFFERATQAFEVLGVLSMVVGFVFAFSLAAVTWKRTGNGGRAFKTLRDTLGGAICSAWSCSSLQILSRP